MKWHCLSLWSPRECGLWWEKPVSVWVCVCVEDEMFSQETEDRRHSVYDSTDIPEDTAERSEGNNLWVWEPKAGWGLVKERCETWRFSWLLGFSPSIPSCLWCLIGGEKDQVSSEGPAVPEVNHLFWEFLVQMIKLVPRLLLLLHPWLKCFEFCPKDLHFLLEDVGGKAKCIQDIVAYSRPLDF